MFCLDRRLPKDWLSRERGSLLYKDYGVLVGNWLPLGYNPSGTLGSCPIELLRNIEGTRTNVQMDYHWQDSHLSVSLEDHDIWFNWSINSSLAKPKITCCSQYQYLQDRNCAETSKIAARLKIRTNIPFQFSLCYNQKNELKSKSFKILHKAPIVRTFLWYSLT